MSRFVCIALGLMGLCLSTVRAESHADSQQANTIATFRVAPRGDFLILPVSIGGAERSFILDTGAMANVLHAPLAEKLPRLKRSKRSYPTGTPVMYEFPQASLVGTSLVITGDAARFDLEKIGQMSGYDIQGILGMSFLEGHIVEFDFDSGTVTFLKSVPSRTVAAIPLGRDAAHRPTIDVSLEQNVATPFIIDTGMAAPGIGELTSALFDKLLKAGRLELVGPAPRVLTVDGNRIARKGEVDVFRLGAFEHRDLRASSGQVNAIGLRYLSRYRMTLDFPGNRAYFEPGERFDAPPVVDASGMIVSRIRGETLVDKVHPDGPAAAAGIQAGDIVTHVNSHPTNEQSLFSFRQLLSLPDQVVVLSIKRATSDKQVAITLRHWQSAVRQSPLEP